MIWIPGITNALVNSPCGTQGPMKPISPINRRNEINATTDLAKYRYPAFPSVEAK
jgi:hypothetical protein